MTGVQTCALPICSAGKSEADGEERDEDQWAHGAQSWQAWPIGLVYSSLAALQAGGQSVPIGK